MASELKQDLPLSAAKGPSSKQQTLITSTLSSPRFAYAHLGLFTEGLLIADQQRAESAAAATSTPRDGASQPEEGLDALEVRAYCSAALRRFLGDTGAGIPVDVLRVRGRDAWVRVPREDLAAFAAALTAFPGMKGSGREVMMMLRLLASGDWLGSLIGRAEERTFFEG